MGRALSIVWRGITDTYSELFPMVGMNLIWLAISALLAIVLLPLWLLPSGMMVDMLVNTVVTTEDANALQELTVSIAIFFTVFTLIFGPNPGYLGIHSYVNHLLNEHPTYFGMVWEGFRKYWARGLALFGITTLIYIVLSVSIVFYFTRGNTIGQIIGVICLYIVVLIWTPMQMYILPLLYEQADKRFRLIFRNAVLLVMDNLVVTLTLLIVTIALAAVSIVVTILISMITASLLAAIQQRATLTLLDKYKARGAALTR